MPESALIFGCGYLGRVVARRWLNQSVTVYALTRSRTSELEAQGIIPIMGDVTNLEGVTLPKTDRVLYAIGMDRSAGKSMREVYLQGLNHVLDRLPVGSSFAYVSSTSVYGQTSGEWVTEDSVTEPVEENGKLLLECERLLQTRRPDAMILRFAGIYGPGRVIRRAAIERGEPLVADAEKWLNLIHVADGATVVDRVTKQPTPGAVFNVCDGQPVTRRTFYTRMAELLNAPTARFETPSPGTITGTHDRTDRRISNAKLLEVYPGELAFPNFEAGLIESIGRG